MTRRRDRDQFAVLSRRHSVTGHPVISVTEPSRHEQAHDDLQDSRNCGRRSSSRSCSWPSIASASHIPLPIIDQTKMAEPCTGVAGGAGPGPRLRLDVLRRQPEPEPHLRPGHHALHLRVDYLPAPRQRLSAAGKAAEGRRERPQEDQRIHALRHGRHLPHPGVLLGAATSTRAERSGGLGPGHARATTASSTS